MTQVWWTLKVEAWEASERGLTLMEEQWPSRIPFASGFVYSSCNSRGFLFCFVFFNLLSWQEEGEKTFNLNFNFFYNLYDKLELLETLTLKVQVTQTDRFRTFFR